MTAQPLPDHLAPGLRVVFCGINPGTRSGATGHHYAGPGNRFWSALAGGGLTERQLAPEEDATLLERGFGLTNLVARTTPGSADLAAAELSAGRAALEAKLARHRPEWLACVGVTVFRALFAERGRLRPGRTERVIDQTRVWLLSNPSGRNAHVSQADLVAQMCALADELSLPRFALLAHETDPPHRDLLLERDDACWCWRLPLDGPADGRGAERIHDHRKHYLAYEGPVSGDRGAVRRLDRGSYRLRSLAPLVVELDGLAGVTVCTLPT